jgi:hypothetical protein
MGIVQPKDNIFAAFVHERVHLAIAEYCNESPRFPSYSVGKLEFYCDRNGCFNMLYDFDPNRPMYIRGNKKSYSNFFTGMLIHEKLRILDYQEVHMELDGVGGHFDDLSACGRWLIDKKTLVDVLNWTNKYLPREMHCRQITFYRALAHFGTLVEDVEIDGEVQMFNDEPLVAGHKPQFNIKKVNIVYLPMNDVADPRYAEVDRKWMDMPVQAAAKMLLDKKDRIDSHMTNGTLPERSPSYECGYCRWYDDCYNTGKYEVNIPDYLAAKLDTMPTLGGGYE